MPQIRQSQQTGTAKTSKSADKQTATQTTHRSAPPAPVALQSALTDPLSASRAQVLQLQRHYGNRAIQRLIQRAALQRDQDSIGLEGGEVGGDLQNQINSARGGGQPLDRGVGSQIGGALGADFSGVKVHTDSKSDNLNRSLNAKAFTLGSDMFFSKGAYNPGTQGGKELLAHELTHVVQQGGGKSNKVQTKLTVGPAGDKYEEEADQVAKRVRAAPTAPIARSTKEDDSQAVQRSSSGNASAEAPRPNQIGVLQGVGVTALPPSQTIVQRRTIENKGINGLTHLVELTEDGHIYNENWQANEREEVRHGDLLQVDIDNGIYSRRGINQETNAQADKHGPQNNLWLEATSLNNHGLLPDRFVREEMLTAANLGDWRLKTQGSQKAKLSKETQPQYGCNEFNIREEGLCHAAVMVRIAIELGQIGSLPATIKDYLEKQKKGDLEISNLKLYDNFMSKIVELDNEFGSSPTPPPLLNEFLGILDEQTEEKKDQVTFPKIKKNSQGGFIHITSLEPSDEEEISSSINQFINEQSIAQKTKEEEWDSSKKAIQEEAKPILEPLKEIALKACLEKQKIAATRAFENGDFNAALAYFKDKENTTYKKVDNNLQPYKEKLKVLGHKPKRQNDPENERTSLMDVKTKNKLGEKANQIFFEKLNSIILDNDAKVNPNLPIVIQLMVGMHVICLISDSNRNPDTTLVDDINCTKLTTLGGGRADIFINEAARGCSFSEARKEGNSKAKNIIETHAILYNVKPEKIPKSKQEHITGWFKGNPKNKLYAPDFYKV